MKEHEDTLAPISEARKALNILTSPTPPKMVRLDVALYWVSISILICLLVIVNLYFTIEIEKVKGKNSSLERELVTLKSMSVNDKAGIELGGKE